MRRHNHKDQTDPHSYLATVTVRMRVLGANPVEARDHARAGAREVFNHAGKRFRCAHTIEVVSVRAEQDPNVELLTNDANIGTPRLQYVTAKDGLPVCRLPSCAKTLFTGEGHIYDPVARTWACGWKCQVEAVRLQTESGGIVQGWMGMDGSVDPRLERVKQGG